MADSLFPESATIRKVSREGVLLAGAGRALLLQVAHPAIAQGVADHSDFGADPYRRLQGTLDYLVGVIFGTRAEAEHVSALVDAVHGHIVGPGYSARDPQLQVWVNATLFDTTLLIYERIFGPLADAEALYQEYAVVATSLGCPRGSWPANLASFRVYWAGMVRTLQVSDTGRKVARGVLHPRLGTMPVTLWPSLPVHRFVTTGLLPAPIRRQYGLTWDARREVVLKLALLGMRVVYPRVPVLLRASLPVRYNLYLLRRRLSSSV